jgi:hypothetical protein
MHAPALLSVDSLAHFMCMFAAMLSAGWQPATVMIEPEVCRACKDVH